MIHSKDLNFSFSGLKTSVLYKLKELGEINDATRAEIARAFEDASIDVLIQKTRQAIETYGPKTLIIAGGVAMNTHLKREAEKLSKEFGSLSLHTPEPALTTDNAVMIGIASYINIKTGWKPILEKIQAKGNLSL
jgi:N6-L-threonylcarbamoyladenine synthase